MPGSNPWKGSIANAYDGKVFARVLDTGVPSEAEPPDVLDSAGDDVSPPVAVACELGLTRLISWIVRLEVQRLDKEGISFMDMVEYAGPIEPSRRPWWMRPERCTVEKFIYVEEDGDEVRVLCMLDT